MYIYIYVVYTYKNIHSFYFTLYVGLIKANLVQLIKDKIFLEVFFYVCEMSFYYIG